MTDDKVKLGMSYDWNRPNQVRSITWLVMSLHDIIVAALDPESYFLFVTFLDPHLIINFDEVILSKLLCLT